MYHIVLPFFHVVSWQQIPVIVAENKFDLYAPENGGTSSTATSSFSRSPSDEALQRKRQQIVSMMQRFPFVRQSIKCSAKIFLRVDDVFLKAQQAVLYPFNPLYDLQKGRMSFPLQRALMRMFRMYDVDCDNLLSDNELARFQREVIFLDYELATWKKIVGRHDPTIPSPVLKDGKFTVTGFLVIFDVLINQNRLEKVWEALRIFGYDDELRLDTARVVEEHEETVSRNTVLRKQQPSLAKSSWKLSVGSRRFLYNLFRQFTSDGASLSSHDMSLLFSVLEPPLPPWSAQRSSVIFRNEFSQPKQYGGGNGSPSPSSSLSEEVKTPPRSPRAEHIPPTPDQDPLSSSGISILSASDSLPSIGSLAVASSSGATSLSQKKMDISEWMGHWHLMAAISPLETKRELFRLGYVEKRHRAKRAGFGVSGMQKSQEIRVLVLGSNQKAGFIRSLCSEPRATKDPEPESSVPESSHAHVKIKRTKNSRKVKSDEIEAHLIFTNIPTSKASEAFQDQEYDLVMLVFDTTDMSTLDECQKLEREHLRKDIPRVYVAANMDKLPEEKKRVLQAAAKHCIVNELEGQPLLFSESDDVDRYLDHLARSCLRERGIAGLQSSPYEAQKRRRDQLVQGIGLSVLVVIGVGLCSLALFKNWFFSSPSGAARKK